MYFCPMYFSLLTRGNNIVCDILRHGVVMIEFHRHIAAAFSHRAES